MTLHDVRRDLAMVYPLFIKLSDIGIYSDPTHPQSIAFAESCETLASLIEIVGKTAPAPCTAEAREMYSVHAAAMITHSFLAGKVVIPHIARRTMRSL